MNVNYAAILRRCWRHGKRKPQLNNEVQLVELQLRERLETEEGRIEAIIRALKEFFTGRGLNLILALLAFLSMFMFCVMLVAA